MVNVVAICRRCLAIWIPFISRQMKIRTLMEHQTLWKLKAASLQLLNAFCRRDWLTKECRQQVSRARQSVDNVAPEIYTSDVHGQPQASA